MDQRIIDLYNDYTHSRLDRRSFLERLGSLAGGMGAAMALVPLLKANDAAAAQVDPGDARLHTGTISFAGHSGTIEGYLAKPKEASSTLPGIVVIHENRGLSVHIQDVARRVALGGYVALAPDFLSPLGRTPQDEDRARELIGRLNAHDTLQDAVATVRALRGREDTTDRIGAVGFCWGGGLTGRLATADPTLNAAVVFYGPTPDPAQVKNIEAALLLHYAGLDQRINAGIPAFRAALDRAEVDYTLHMYEGRNHAFHNDTSAARYDAEAAKLAWDRTMAFFGKHLSG